MTRRLAGAALLMVFVVALGGCGGDVIRGTSTWRGARLEQAALTASDFPSGVQYARIDEVPGQPDGQGGPPAMLSRPEGCSDGLTRVIAGTAERGPGSAYEYVVGYDGARIVMTVLSSPLDLEGLAAAAHRCAEYVTFFDPNSPGLPVTTSRLDVPRRDALAYEQSMKLGGARNSVYFTFENVGDSAVFGIAFPTPDPTIGVKATLPQTFLDVASKQAQQLEAR